jgi:hypothetical protein
MFLASGAIRYALGLCAAAVLAGCAGASQVNPLGAVPSGEAPSSRTASAGDPLAQIAPGIYPHPSKERNLRIGKGKSLTWAVPAKKGKKCEKDCLDLVIASDETYGDLDIFTGAPDPTYISTASDYGGWGVASYGNDVAAFGSSGYGILVGMLSESASSVTLKTTAQLTMPSSSCGECAQGLAFDSKGDLYSDNWLSTCMYEWYASSIAKYSGAPLSPNRKFCSSDLKEVVYLAAYQKVLYAVGWDNNGNEALDTITSFSKEDLTEDPIESGPDDAGKPGGVAAAKNGEVYVNDQNPEDGVIYGYAAGQGSANQSVSWGVDPNQFTAINLDYSQQNLWAANIYFGGSYSQIVDNSVPLGETFTESANSPNSYEVYVGIAALSAQK